MPAFLRPGQGFQDFMVLSRETAISDSGSVSRNKDFIKKDEIKGILATTSPKERETWKQNGYEVTNHVVAAGPPKAKKNDYLYQAEAKRIYRISEIKNPGGLGHCSIYYVEEREDLQYVPTAISTA